MQRRALHPHSFAAQLQSARSGSDGAPREVPGSAWGFDAGRDGAGFIEHAIALGPDLGVMSWIVAV